MLKNGYTSRSMPSPQRFEEVYNRRLAAKKAGDTATANALKLVVNTTYGAMLNRYNPLHDGLMGRSVCISGQLFLVELAEHLYKDIEGLEIVALKTDSIMIKFDDSHYDEVKVIINEWQDRTHFQLEEDKVELIAAANVNNYCMIVDGHEKVKGGMLVRGVAKAGAFNINNQAVIVAEAIREYFLHGTPAADTINACDDISKFQLIAKAGAKYRDAAWEYGGKKYPVQKVNRVYASNDPLAGRITKVKIADDSEALIASMPDHSVIDNRAVLTVQDIDKGWYIALAEKRIDDFKGIKPGKKDKMAASEKKLPNAYARLAEARVQFLNQHVDPSGKHMKMQFTYFELKDIVPSALRIFQSVGLLAQDVFDNDFAQLNIINIDDPADIITFSLPFVRWEGNAGVNPMQALGASVTYLRRYLYLIALDICENDEIDNCNSIQDSPAPKPANVVPLAAPAAKPKAATPVEREQTKVALTNADGPADELQIQQLKNALKKLKVEIPSAAGFIAALSLATKGFTTLTKVKCEELMVRLKTATPELLAQMTAELKGNK